ncbi:hypothetical protein COW99_04325 [Candidatus Roizmanbacteria bacterium CG22_combo_CG10-13_8_21_14_all_38_20]|uniref:Glycosyl transferase family 1 n=1 Tax=Candidatus Roizmanbacteria bacterium CG22_combo_CG10-13_8_21_14_all_38_20 TaxID=1974862 RepID=A0A2H0BUN3_9BACT|nr:MAG: hypothetical protein COW99_04325 [Candidatus Roizmanbacteria bacterium CG22_combo_CG10-13_8_21_14_all_38_20]PJC30521.1 MAG: hypothetical protein CO050_06065 [Candidatus Roizmanbacteria bacterium CG_4_9_14_0_2_um_filter_38_17]
MAKIIAIAENFAFGPVSKLITVCEKLLEKGHHVSFVGDGTAYQLASRVKFSKVYRFDTDSKEFMNWGKDLFKQADALLSSVDRSSVILAKKVNLPVIWLDMLYWWWDEIPDYLFDVDLYIQQNSVKNERNMKKYAQKIKNMVIVGPIIDISYKNNPQKKQLLIAYGGTEAAGWYKIGKDSNYPYTFSKLIVNEINTDRYDSVLFAGNEKIMADLDKKYGNGIYKFTILSHAQWLQEVASSQDILINPGLEAPLEAIAYEKPIFFLPPYNSSAYVELDEFREKGIATLSNSIHFSDYFQHKQLAGRDLKKIMKEFLEELRKFENSSEILNDCAKRINKYIQLPESIKKHQISVGKKFISQLGNNGLDHTVEIIDSFVCSLTK